MRRHNPNIGLFNTVLSLVGVEGRNWLGDAALVKNSIILVMVWYSLGFYMVLFMAAILNIPADLFEASRIDGCSTVRQVFTITIPLIWEQIRTALVFFIVTSCGTGFNVVFMLTSGGPSKASEILPRTCTLCRLRAKQVRLRDVRGGHDHADHHHLALLILRLTKRKP